MIPQHAEGTIRLLSLQAQILLGVVPGAQLEAHVVHAHLDVEQLPVLLHMDARIALQPLDEHMRLVRQVAHGQHGLGYVEHGLLSVRHQAMRACIAVQLRIVQLQQIGQGERCAPVAQPAAQKAVAPKLGHNVQVALREQPIARDYRIPKGGRYVYVAGSQLPDVVGRLRGSCLAQVARKWLLRGHRLLQLALRPVAGQQLVHAPQRRVQGCVAHCQHHVSQSVQICIVHAAIANGIGIECHTLDAHTRYLLSGTIQDAFLRLYSAQG